MFKRCTTIVTIVLFVLLIVPFTAFCAEKDGWIKGDTCWVVKTPSRDAKIVGIIKKKAAVTVETARTGWLRIVFAPVRNPQTGKWLECTGCYIEESNFTTTLPNRW